MTPSAFVPEKWEVHLLLRLRALEKAGAPGAHIDLQRRTVQPVYPEVPLEYLDPARPKPAPAATAS